MSKKRFACAECAKALRDATIINRIAYGKCWYCGKTGFIREVRQEKKRGSHAGTMIGQLELGD